MAKGIIGATYNGLTEERIEKLRAICEGYGYELKTAHHTAGVEFYEDCDIIFGTPKPALVAELKNLKWLQTSSAGVDAYCKPGIMPEGALLSNAKGGYGIGIAEHMFMQLLMLMKNSVGYYHQQGAEVWKSRGEVKGIYGSVITVVGLGDIGGEFAKRIAAFGGIVRGVKRTATDKPEYVDELYTFEELDKALEGADVVALSLPNTPNTIGILSAERIQALKGGCIVINVGRGSAIDEDALVTALNSGHLGGAALDVAAVEPLPQDHPLWRAKNCLITPHVSGGITFPVTINNVIKVFTDNLACYVEGKELITNVNRKEGY